MHIVIQSSMQSLDTQYVIHTVFFFGTYNSHLNRLWLCVLYSTTCNVSCCKTINQLNKVVLVLSLIPNHSYMSQRDCCDIGNCSGANNFDFHSSHVAQFVVIAVKETCFVQPFANIHQYTRIVCGSSSHAHVCGTLT